MISKFEDSPDDENMIFRKIRDGIEVGVYPVLFGYRIRAGIIGDGAGCIDYCAGNDLKEVENIYSLVISIMNKLMDEGIFLGVRDAAYHIFPRQQVKPMFNDFECFMKLSELCGPEIISIHLPNLAARKVRHTLTYHGSAFQTLVDMGSFDDLLDGEDSQTT